jgi:hypothetical protein
MKLYENPRKLLGLEKERQRDRERKQAKGTVDAILMRIQANSDEVSTYLPYV